MGYRTNRCSHCYEYGHNRRGCPKIKSAYEKIENLIKKHHVKDSDSSEAPRYWWPAHRLVSEINQKSIEAHNVLPPTAEKLFDVAPEDYIEHWEAYLWKEARERELAKATRMSSPRRCGFCNETGHNRRKCPEREQHKLDCRAMVALAHRIARASFEKAGLVPGALVKYREYDYNVRDYVERLGMVEAIIWNQVGEQDTDKNHLNRVIDTWIFGDRTVKIRDHHGETRYLSPPRNIEQQTDYFYRENPAGGFQLACPVYGSSVNLDGYEGASRFPVDKDIWTWGEWIDKKFGREVVKLAKEVGCKVLSC
jgi:hypothetical protein